MYFSVVVVNARTDISKSATVVVMTSTNVTSSMTCVVETALATTRPVLTSVCARLATNLTERCVKFYRAKHPNITNIWVDYFSLVSTWTSALTQHTVVTSAAHSAQTPTEV